MQRLPKNYLKKIHIHLTTESTAAEFGLLLPSILLVFVSATGLYKLTQQATLYD